jgi:hypothetical protein
VPASTVSSCLCGGSEVQGKAAREPCLCPSTQTVAHLLLSVPAHSSMTEVLMALSLLQHVLRPVQVVPVCGGLQRCCVRLGALCALHCTALGLMCWTSEAAVHCVATCMCSGV